MEYQPNEITSVDLITNEIVYNKEKMGTLFMEFIREYKTTHKPYFHLLHNNLLQNKWTMRIRLEHINQYSAELYEQVMRQPEKNLECFEKRICTEFKISLFQIQLVSGGAITRIRDVNSRRSNRLVRVEGIVVSCSRVLTRAKELYVTCRNCLSSRTVKDIVPRSCERSGCPVDSYVVVAEKSILGDVQYIKLQEKFEEIPEGETPRQVSVELEGELVDELVAGSLAGITGIYRMHEGREVSGFIRALGVETRRGRGEAVFSEEEEEIFRELARTGMYEKIAKSIAPSIYGNVDVKKALACQLFGGTRREKEDGICLRGDINILLLGDPGIAKSQLLKFMEKAAPIAVYTSGKGSSAAGLTAAVLRDARGTWSLEAGALVLANGGVCCIDEFDKMSVRDQVAIHEAMEQQVISIAKAGITTVLNTRTAILAAANPVFGRYDDYKTPADNIEFGTTILSRFDCIFILKDAHGPRDKELADFVVNLHVGKGTVTNGIGADFNAVNKMLNNNGCEISSINNIKENENNEADSNVLTEDIIPVEVLRRYVQYARARVAPTLSKEAATKLQNFYVGIRDEVAQMSGMHQKKGPIPITVRQLEALVRISEALARMELLAVVSTRHVEEAIRLFQVSTMNAVSQGHLIEGMVRPSFFGEINDTISKINDYIPVGTSKKYTDLSKAVGGKEAILKKAVDYLVKQGKLISKDYGRILVRLP